METSIFKTILVISFVWVNTSIHAQLWTPTSASKTSSKAKELRKTTPTTFQLFDLNTKVLTSTLKKAPSRTQQKSANAILELPVNGMMKKFRILEASILDNGLQKKFPSIKSFVGYGIDDPTSIARFSYSKIGLHAMITSGNHKTIYIDPYTKDKRSYITYSKKDLPANPDTFECLVEDNFKTNFSEQQIPITKNANDGRLRTFRLAVACTGEYSQFHLNNQGIPSGASDQLKKETVLAAVNTTMTRVNGIFERDLAITMVIVNNNTDIIFLDPNTDNFSNNNTDALLNESQTVCDQFIGDSNYDIGHVFSTASGGLARLESVCDYDVKARGTTGIATPIGDPFDVDFVAHEIGHQFGATHTFNGTTGNCDNLNRSDITSYEPGSGTTIMAYAGICSPQNIQNNSSDYFHTASYDQIIEFVTNGGGSCANVTVTGNTSPSVDAGGDYFIPVSTPFVLTGSATDDDGDALTYCWEQFDLGPASPPNDPNSSGPLFRSFPPVMSPSRTFPQLSDILNNTATMGEILPAITRTMNFRLTVRDNAPGGGGLASDNTRITVAGAAGPFVVSAPNTNVSWSAGSIQTVTWDVAGTTGNGINAANVDILLSTDGGNTYPIMIGTAAANDGSQNITVPNAVGTQNRIMVRGSGHIFYDISNANFEITPGNGVDTEAPTVPTNLTASNSTQTTVDLSWNASTDNIGVTAYDVYRGNTIIASITTTSYQVTGLTGNTAYSFRVRAKDALSNVSGFSNTANATTLPVDTEAPTAPTNLTASNSTQTTVDLSWNASTDNIGVTAYDVYRGNTIIASVTATSYQVTGLTENTTYSFRVKAKDAMDNVSGFSNTANATTLPVDTEAPTAPTNLIASNSTQTTVDLSWNASTDNIGVTAYHVYQGNTIIASVTTTSYQVTGLTENTTYSFRVKAKDAMDNVSGFSNTANATTLPVDTEAPTAPTNLITSNSTQTTVDLSWNASTDNIGVAGYDVHEGNTVIANATTTSYQVTGLSANTSYGFSIKARDAVGNTSNASNIVNVTTLSGGSACTERIVTFPYNESFENTFGDWTQGAGDDFEWSVNTNGTLSRNTGPSNAAKGAYYMYMESSRPNNPTKRAILNSPCFDLSGSTAATFSFQYHMYGASRMGSLALEASNDSGATWNTIWSRSGNQGNAWQSTSVDLITYVGDLLLLRFNGVTGDTWQGDMAIDDINLSQAGGPSTCTDVALILTFDDSPQETSWQITDTNNQVIASGGTYALQPDGSTLTLTECLEPGTYTLTLLDSYGDGMCCRYGNGSYSLTSQGSTIASGGSFGSSESTIFTISNASGSFTIEDIVTTEQFSIRVFPNPVKKDRILNVVFSKKDTQYEIVNLLGNILMKGKLVQKSINTSQLSSGMYILNITDGGKTTTIRFIQE
ncbi:fibronectin type III domain-containing protein [Aquimarina gracilis]|uniref:Fibronectin type III domain-containing protein n=1 Tax=Aquimarina gracilis TaxID=874422 RepID=A0ABU5ZVK1_9FLAO|nr:fibronectin type III domain-containing protein [Aquimarina gracilis]MEB3345847.1 fibronectin type III domain-containing protein [Aquimarina gracilis]